MPQPPGMQGNEQGFTRRSTDTSSAVPVAQPPEAPPLSRTAAQAREDQQLYRALRAVQERRSMLRGLILLAVAAVLVAMLHYGAGRALPAGWWRQW